VKAVKNRNNGTVLVALIAMTAMASPALAHQDQAPAAGQAQAGAGESCDIPVHVSEEAEHRLGGAHYHGAMSEHHEQHDMASGAMSEQHQQHVMASGAMAGAHMDHRPPHGGAFFMAPNKLHHLEAVYSEACGLRVFFYNAFTEAIHVERFRTFVRVIPKAEDEPEVLRFLSSASHGTVLTASFGDHINRPFAVELYVAFPGSEEPQLFNIQVP
jgi:hypothetical protein